MKRILAFILALVLCLPVVGCEEEKQIKIACDDNLINSQCVTRAVEYYESNSNAEVTVVEYSRDMLDDPSVDVFIHPLDSDFIEYGLEDNFYDFSYSGWIDNIQDYCYDSVVYNSRVFGLPYGTAYVTGCFYNKRIFRELNLKVPETQQEFEAVCNALYEAGITPLYVAGGDTWPVAFHVGLDNILSERPAYASELNSGDVVMAEISGVSRMLDWWKRGAYNGWFGEDWYNAKFDNAAEVLGGGDAAMLICSDEWINENLSSEYKYSNWNFGIMPIFMDVHAKGFLTGSQVSMISVKKNSPNVETAVEFVNMISKPEVYNLCYQGISTIPIFDDQTTIVTSKHFNSVDDRRIESMMAFYPRISYLYQFDGANAVKDYANGNISINECLKELSNGE